MIPTIYLEILSATLVIMVWSFLLKGDNPIYQLIENIFVGLTIGFTMWTGFDTLQKQLIVPLLAGNIYSFLVLILGILLFMQMIPGYSHLARFPMAWLIGVGSGVALIGIPKAQILTQLTIKSFVQPNPFDGIGNFIYAVGLITAILYFIFTREHSGALGTSTKIGRFFLMINFGVSLGSLTSTQIGFPLDPMNQLFGTQGGRITTAIAGIIIIIYLARLSWKSK